MNNISKEDLNIYFLNCNSISNKLSEIKEFLSETKVDIMCLTETWIKKFEPKFKNYSTVWKHRMDRPGGGLGFLINSNISYRAWPLTEYNNGALEIQAIEIYLSNTNTLKLINTYNPGKNVTEQEINHYLEQIGNSFIIVGDFNAHSNILNTETTQSNRTGRTIENLLIEGKLCLVNPPNLYTYLDRRSGKQSCLDLCFTSDDIFPITSISSSIDLGSDHTLMSVNVQVKPHKTAWNNMSRWHVTKDKLLKFNSHFIKSTIISPTDIDNLTDDFTDRVTMSATTSFGPLQKRKETKKRSTPWWTEDCKKAVSERRKARRKLQTHPTDDNLKQYRKTHSTAKYIIKKAKKESLHEFISSLTHDTPQQKVWAKIKAFKSTYVPPSFPIEDNDTIILDPILKANKLAEHYQQQSPAQTQVLPEYEQIITSCFNENKHSFNNEITMQELESCMDNLKHKSPGPDKISNLLIQNLNVSYREELLNIFNQSLTSGHVPYKWKFGHIIPIQKPQKPRSECSSYRPVTLLSCFGKLMERILQRRLEKFIESNNVLQQEQNGFRPGKSTSDVLSRLCYQIQRCFTIGGCCSVIYLDLKGAFDNVWRLGLLYKMANANIRGKILRWYSDYLTNRKIAVSLQGNTSREFEIFAGVPQGAVSSPMLFNLMMSDMPDNPSIHKYVFADDITIACSGPNPAFIRSKLQPYLEKLQDWFNKWGFTINAQKTKMQFFTRQKITGPVIEFQGQVLEAVKEQKLLGVYLDAPSLSWSVHVNYLKLDCARRVSVMKSISSIKWGASYVVLRRLYLAYIRPKITYCSLVFCTISDKLMQKLNVIQNSCLRLMLGARRTSPILSLEAETKIPPLRLYMEYLSSKYFLQLHYRPPNDITAITLLKSKRKDVRSFETETPLQSAAIDLLKKLDVDTKRNPLPVVRSIQPFLTKNYIKTEQYDKIITQDTFKLYLEKFYPQYIEVYTDGSKKNDPDVSVASGIYIPNLDFVACWKLNPEHTVVGAELFAIYKSLQFIEKNLPNNCVVFTDSLSSLLLLMSNNRHYFQISEEIINLLVTLNRTRRVILHWIKAHAGIMGNELADEAANSGHSNDRSAVYEVQLEEKICQLTAKFSILWNQYWQEQCSMTRKGLFHRNIRDNIMESTPVDTKMRQMDIAMFRLRLGHVGVGKHMNRFNMMESSNCDECDVEETIEHYLMQCPLYRPQRRQLLEEVRRITSRDQQINLKLLLGGEGRLGEGNKKIIRAVGTFIKSTKRLDQM